MLPRVLGQCGCWCATGPAKLKGKGLECPIRVPYKGLCLGFCGLGFSDVKFGEFRVFRVLGPRALGFG